MISEESTITTHPASHYPSNPSSSGSLRYIHVRIVSIASQSRSTIINLDNLRISVTMGKKRVLVSYGVDVDAVAGWLGSYGGEDSPHDISRGTS